MCLNCVTILQNQNVEDDTKYLNESKVANKIFCACVDNNTCVSKTTMKPANEVLEKHGRLITWCYGDAIFNDCNPSNKQNQVVHQAYICKYNTGMLLHQKLKRKTAVSFRLLSSLSLLIRILMNTWWAEMAPTIICVA